MLALWIILGIILWGVGWAIMYALILKNVGYIHNRWDDNDRFVASLFALISWIAIVSIIFLILIKTVCKRIEKLFDKIYQQKEE